MKNTLDNTGVAAFQTYFFSLTLTEQQFLIAQIRTDFLSFMLTYFDLHSNQIDQINDMPDSFRTSLAEGIASTWEAQLHVSFDKETVAADDKPGVKDIIVSSTPLPTVSSTVNSSVLYPFMIWIRYRITS
ncbi:hypothetical protein [Sphingobacterium anhuiense]|uniref:hypothetical protein n=1 Tax=Sphingobacterium anhuiense TaxID=493780 RepID=UPI003C2C89D6